MVCQYGMSAKLGPMTFGHRQDQPFLGKEFGHAPDYSGEVAAEIDREVRALIDEAHVEALEVLVANRAVLEELADALIEKETVEKEELVAVLDKVTARPSRKIQPVWNGDGQKAPSKKAVVTRLRRAQSAAASRSSRPKAAKEPPER
jgi:cell division protease FtsH